MSDIWQCKIGETDVPREEWNYHPGADLPMRNAVRKAYIEITGEEPKFIFSGWAAQLDETERAVVEDRLPNLDVEIEEAQDRLNFLLKQKG